MNNITKICIGAAGVLILLAFVFKKDMPDFGRPKGLEIATSFPKFDGPPCQAKQTHVYDECSDQLELFNQAKAAAAEEGKVLLVVYGAEWCIWCHALHSFLKGGEGNLAYRYGEGEAASDLPVGVVKADLRNPKAMQLAAFVARNFVVFSMDSRRYDGPDPVFEAAGLDDDAAEYLPYVFAVNSDGKYVGDFEEKVFAYEVDGIEWSYIYDRGELMDGLAYLWHAAQG